MMLRILGGVSVLLSIFLCSACTRDGGSGAPDGRLRIVATTGMIGDAVRTVAGDKAEVVTLMGPGVDPHLYKATQGDLEQLSGAGAVFFNGLHLEGKMAEILEQLGRTKPALAVADSLPAERLREAPGFSGHHDPHIWFDVALWALAVERIENALVQLRPDSAEYFQERGARYRRELTELDGWVREQIALIPKERRVLVTAHDAFGYFGRAYDIEVVGLQGVSTATEFGLFDIERIVKLVTERGVKALFVESSVPERFVHAVQAGAEASGHPVSIGGELFSDAMGAEGTPEGTYAGMVRHNVETIVRALR